MSSAAVWREAPYIRVRSPYDPSFVNELKVTFHRDDRFWDPVNRVWCVFGGAPELDRVVALCEKHFDDVYLFNEKAAAVSYDGVDIATEILDTIPAEALPRVERTIRAVLHPDAGGSVTASQTFALLWQRYIARRGL